MESQADKTNKARVAVIVVTYDGEQWIKKCLDSLSISSKLGTIVVIDNQSTDNTPNIVEADFPDVRLIRSESNLGFGGGNNIGLRIAIEEGADYVFLLNQDAWVEPKTIETLVNIAEANPGYGTISPVHMNGDGSLLDKGFLRHLCNNDRKLFTDLLNGQAQQLNEVRFVNAAAWLVRTECIRKVGFFDPIYYHYGEDGNFVDRCRYFGYKMGLCLDTKIWHDREDRAGEQVIDRSFKFERLRTGWVGMLTDPADEDWDRDYSLRLLRFVARNSFTSIVHFLAAPITYLRLWWYRGTIATARLRMQQGYSAYRDLQPDARHSRL